MIKFNVICFNAYNAYYFYFILKKIDFVKIVSTLLVCVTYSKENNGDTQ